MRVKDLDYKVHEINKVYGFTSFKHYLSRTKKYKIFIKCQSNNKDLEHRKYAYRLVIEKLWHDDIYDSVMYVELNEETTLTRVYNFIEAYMNIFEKEHTMNREEAFIKLNQLMNTVTMSVDFIDVENLLYDVYDKFENKQLEQTCQNCREFKNGNCGIYKAAKEFEPDIVNETVFGCYAFSFDKSRNKK